MVDCDRNEIMRCHIYLLTLKCETCFRCLSQMTWTMILMSCCKSLNRVVSGQFYTHYSSTSCSADVFDFVASVVAMLLYSSSLMLCSCMPTRLVPHGTASKLLFLFHLFILCTWICVKKTTVKSVAWLLRILWNVYRYRGASIVQPGWL